MLFNQNDQFGKGFQMPIIMTKLPKEKKNENDENIPNRTMHIVHTNTYSLIHMRCIYQSTNSNGAKTKMKNVLYVFSNFKCAVFPPVTWNEENDKKTHQYQKCCSNTKISRKIHPFIRKPFIALVIQRLMSVAFICLLLFSFYDYSWIIE